MHLVCAPTGTGRSRARLTCSSPSRSTEGSYRSREAGDQGPETGDFLRFFRFFFGVDLPVGQGLGARPDVGDVRIDAGGEARAFGRVLGPVGHTGRLFVTFSDAALLPLALVR